MYRLHSILLVDLTAILFEETRSTRYQPSSPVVIASFSPIGFFLFEFDIAMRFSVTKTGPTARNGPDRIGGNGTRRKGNEEWK